MRKYIFMAIVALISVFTAQAEKGDASAAAQFVYASRHSMAGLGVQIQYEPVARFRIAPEFIYFFESDDRTVINANLNLHYIIPTSTSFAIYPLAGFSYGHFTHKTSSGVDLIDDLVGERKVERDRCGANIGMGAQYRVQDHLYFYTEQRYQIMKDYNQSVTVLGIKYTF
ncbi:MAG: outer membrane beta-barrel protein [Muribaculaceae bacterium]|nr:outer membrane beta-barrel protein [Muribaculaceae bacterium]